MSDRIFGFVVLGLSIFYAFSASLTQASFIQQAVGPKVMPYFLAGIAALCAVYFIARPDPEPDWPKRTGWLEISAAVLVLFLYAQLLPMVGFVIATIGGASYFVWRFCGKPLESVVAGVVISLSLYGIFHLILGLSLA